MSCVRLEMVSASCFNTYEAFNLCNFHYFYYMNIT